MSVVRTYAKGAEQFSGMLITKSNSISVCTGMGRAATLCQRRRHNGENNLSYSCLFRILWMLIYISIRHALTCTFWHRRLFFLLESLIRLIKICMITIYVCQTGRLLDVMLIITQTSSIILIVRMWMTQYDSRGLVLQSTWHAFVLVTSLSSWIFYNISLEKQVGPFFFLRDVIQYHFLNLTSVM